MAKRTRPASPSSAFWPWSDSSVPGRGHHAQALAALVVGQHHDRAVGLEEAAGVAGHLVHDPVELDGLGEDVAQLLEREQLADPAVELAGERSVLLSASRSRRRPRVIATQKLAEMVTTASTASHQIRSSAYQTTTPSRVTADGVERHLPLAAPGGEQHDERAGEPRDDREELRQAAERRRDEGAREQRPRGDGRGREVPALAAAGQARAPAARAAPPARSRTPRAARWA